MTTSELDTREQTGDIHAWDAAIADLELHVGDVEAALVSGDLSRPSALAWRPPTGLGPLPPRFHRRVQTLLVRQEHALGQMSDAFAAVRGELALVSSINADSLPRRTPSFLDLPL
jgi:hypothetical protein